MENTSCVQASFFPTNAVSGPEAFFLLTLQAYFKVTHSTDNLPKIRHIATSIPEGNNLYTCSYYPKPMSSASAMSICTKLHFTAWSLEGH